MSTDRLTELLREVAAAIVEQITPELRAAVDRPAAIYKPDPLTLDVHQVGERLGGLSETTVRKLWKTGELRSVLIGGLRFTRAGDLEAYVAGLQPSIPGASERPALSVVRDAA